MTGPTLRATGLAHDVRKANPYCGYEQYDFEIPTQTDGDIYARYLVRLEEMRQSVRIIGQALNKLPYGPVRDNNHKYVPPPRSEIGVSMEALDPSLQTLDGGLFSSKRIGVRDDRKSAR